MQQPRGKGPGTRILQADEVECGPAQAGEQRIGRQQREHEILDRHVDVIHYLQRDPAAAERRPRDANQLAPEGIARKQQEERQEKHHHGVPRECPHGYRVLPQKAADAESLRLDYDGRARPASRGRAGSLVGGLLDLACRGLLLLQRSRPAVAHARKPGRNLARRLGELLGDRAHLPAEHSGGKHTRAA